MENKDTETIGLKEIMVRYIRRWKLFLYAFLFSFLPAILYLAFYPRTYEFIARVQIQEDSEINTASLGLGGEAAGLMKSFGIGGGGAGISIDDEIAILSSNQLLSQMILDLGLNVEYTKPFSFYKMYHEAPLKLIPDPASTAAVDDEYEFTVSVAKGKVKVKAKSRLGGHQAKLTYTALPAEIKMGDVNFTLAFDNGASIDQDFKLHIKYIPANWIAEGFAEEFMIEEVSNSSNVIELGCTDHAIERGKAMLNTLIRRYNEMALDYKRKEDQKTMSFVEDRIHNVVSELDAVELDIEKYKERNDMTLLESDVLFYTEQMKELQAKIIETEAQFHVLNMMDEYVRNPANKYEVIPSLLAIDGEKGVGTLSVYNEAILERDRLLTNSNEQNLAFKSINAQVDKLREGVYLMIENAKTGCQITLEDLKVKEKVLIGKMKSVPVLEREYVSYTRQQEILQGVYLILLQKREETILSLGHEKERARIIDPAVMLKKPVGPRKLYAAIGMMILTLLFPVVYLFAKDLFISLRDEYRRTSLHNTTVDY
jgi:uncharacterized protein involved in exopolysaccharide biosynthesis